MDAALLRASIPAIRQELYNRLAFVGTLQDFTPIPATLHEGLVEYVLTGRPTGHFLQAVIEGRLFEACNRADLHSRHALYGVVYWFVNYTPVGCYGTSSQYDYWRSIGGLAGLRRQEESGDGS